MGKTGRPTSLPASYVSIQQRTHQCNHCLGSREVTVSRGEVLIIPCDERSRVGLLLLILMPRINDPAVSTLHGTSDRSPSSAANHLYSRPCILALREGVSECHTVRIDPTQARHAGRGRATQTPPGKHDLQHSRSNRSCRSQNGGIYLPRSIAIVKRGSIYYGGP